MDAPLPPGTDPRDAAIVWHQRALEHDARANVARTHRDAAISAWKATATLAVIGADLDITDAAVHKAIARHHERT